MIKQIIIGINNYGIFEKKRKKNLVFDCIENNLKINMDKCLYINIVDNNS